jgi:putative ABC transport system permease protein
MGVDTTDQFTAGYTALARLAPDVTPERARLMLESRWPEVTPLPPGAPYHEEWRVRLLRDRRVGDAARVAWLLVGAVAAFLLIACVNVTNLMLARVGERQREFAVRAAVGAGTVRLARLALAESLLLALAAGGVGLLVASALLETFVAMAPPGFPGIAEASIDLRVFVVAALLVAVTGTAIGMWPAISVLRVRALHGLRATATSSPGARPRVRFALVTAQIALTLALLGGSALLLRSLWNVVSVPLGFDAGRVVTLTAGFNPVRYPTAEHGAAFLDELLARARATPGAVSAALSDAPPPPLASPTAPIEVEGRAAEPGAPPSPIRFRSVTPGYFETFRIPVLQGRPFQEADLAGEPAVALNESAARVLFAGEPALGGRIRFRAPPVPPGLPARPPFPWYTVVGVIADVRNASVLTDEPNPEIYFAARPGRWMELIQRGQQGGVRSLRTTASPADATAFLRQIVADLDSRQLVTVQTGDELFRTVTAQPRFIAWLLTAFAALALVLAAAGLYSVASYLVTQRRRDIAVRMAIGAAPGDVAGHVVGEAGRWIAAGALIGCALGWMATRGLQSQLYDVQPLDPWSWTGAVLALALALLMAVVRPAYRAAHVDPIAALRAE